MHVEFRKSYAPDLRTWAFKYGFGIWIWKFIFSIGHDTRKQTVGKGA
jgi:hypothetical protein